MAGVKPVHVDDMDSDLLLRASLSADYPDWPGVLDNFELKIGRGEIVGLVGESGSGKSTVALSLLRLLNFKGGVVRGEIRFQGRNLMELPERQMREVRGRDIGLILQSPLSSLNPAMCIGDQLSEAWRAHRRSRRQERPDVEELLQLVNLPPEPAFRERYPHQISVGQAQRVVIALAIVHRPALLLADEPTSALDPLNQSEILKLFSRLNQQLGMGILYISHDLLSVGSFCHRIAILRRGRVVECNSSAEVFRNPDHPYTKMLLGAIPKLAFAEAEEVLSF
jgi:ABC-type dipeptide/oligopeptide/nickel transport system ATPase component